MTIERVKELGFDEVRRLILDKVFVIDALALQDNNGALINGGFTFINTLLSFTLGKVHFISTKKESHQELSRWIDRWHISSHQLFMRPQIWDPKESALKLIKGVSASDNGGVIVLTHSSKLEQSIVKKCPEVFKVMKVDKEAHNFNYHRVWLQFHDPNFWDKK